MTILTLITFPYACLALWEGKTLIYHDIRQEKDSLEILLPNMMHAFKKKHNCNIISKVATISGPGPFTTIRGGQAFALGLAAGLGVALYAPTFFQIFPNSSLILIDIGTDQWVDYQGNTHQPNPIFWRLISPAHLSEQEVLDLCRLLADQSILHEIHPSASSLSSR